MFANPHFANNCIYSGQVFINCANKIFSNSIRQLFLFANALLLFSGLKMDLPHFGDVRTITVVSEILFEDPSCHFSRAPNTLLYSKVQLFHTDTLTAVIRNFFGTPCTPFTNIYYLDSSRQLSAYWGSSMRQVNRVCRTRIRTGGRPINVTSH